jgi:hypothetical protein
MTTKERKKGRKRERKKEREKERKRERQKDRKTESVAVEVIDIESFLVTSKAGGTKGVLLPTANLARHLKSFLLL